MRLPGLRFNAAARTYHYEIPLDIAHIEVQVERKKGNQMTASQILAGILYAHIMSAHRANVRCLLPCSRNGRENKAQWEIIDALFSHTTGVS